MSELDVYTRAYIVDVVRHGQENRLPENVVSEKNYDALAARVARYEKALNYYANAKLYKGGFDNDGDGHFDQYGYDILDDEGQTARRALADGGSHK